MANTDHLPKCIGCGRPIQDKPQKVMIAVRSAQDHARCQTCWEVGDLFLITQGKGDLA